MHFGPIVIPVALLFGFVYGLRSSLRGSPTQADEFIATSIRRDGRYAVLAGMVMSGGVLFFALLVGILPKDSFNVLERREVCCCFVLAMIKASGAGYAATLSTTWLSTRLLPANAWSSVAQAGQRGLVIGGLLSIGVGSVYSAYIAFVAKPILAETIIGLVIPSFADKISIWMTGFNFSGALFLGALVGAATVIWRSRVTMAQNQATPETGPL